MCFVSFISVVKVDFRVIIFYYKNNNYCFINLNGKDSIICKSTVGMSFLGIHHVALYSNNV